MFVTSTLKAGFTILCSLGGTETAYFADATALMSSHKPTITLTPFMSLATVFMQKGESINSNCLLFVTDLMDLYDGGERRVVGDSSTAHLFTSFPHRNIAKVTGFFDVVSTCWGFNMYYV